jgi:hypothetical protein
LKVEAQRRCVGMRVVPGSTTCTRASTTSIHRTRKGLTLRGGRGTVGLLTIYSGACLRGFACWLYPQFFVFSTFPHPAPLISHVQYSTDPGGITSWYQ